MPMASNISAARANVSLASPRRPTALNPAEDDQRPGQFDSHRIRFLNGDRLLDGLFGALQVGRVGGEQALGENAPSDAQAPGLVRFGGDLNGLPAQLRGRGDITGVQANLGQVCPEAAHKEVRTDLAGHVEALQQIVLRRSEIIRQEMGLGRESRGSSRRETDRPLRC